MGVIFKALLGFATGGIGRWVALGAAVAIVGAGLYIRDLRQDVALLKAEKVVLERDLSDAVAVGNANAAVVDAIRADSRHREEALARERDAFAERATRLSTIIGEIQNAPQTSDGPVARVLRDALDRLRPDAGPAGAAADGVRPPDRSGEPAGLRGRPGASGG